MRASFRSDIGFLLSAAGSAIGLGNIWKFPYITGVNGGGFFVIFYLMCACTIALPVLIAEITIGQKSKSNAVKSFDILSKKPSNYKIAGILGLIASILIISFYGVVGGWIVFYLYESLGSWLGFAKALNVEELFDTAVGNATISLSCQAIFLCITFFIVARGVNKGIEKINKIAIPFLALILVFLLFSVSKMPGFDQALSFLFSFHQEQFTFKGALEAIGHSFFTVSVGVGIMITYGSYLPHSQHIARISIVIVLVDTLIALISGIVIFAILFSFESTPGQGPILMFKTLPALFKQMGNGGFIASSFFLLVLLTAITSAISLLEVPVSYLVDKGIKRSQALLIMGFIITFLSVPCGLSFNLLSDVKIFSFTFFDLFDSVSSKFLLPVSGLICVLFFAYRMDKEQRKACFTNKYGQFIFSFLAKVFAPLCIIVIMIGEIFG